MKKQNQETARRLQEALNDKNMKAQELVDLSGVSKASISQYLSGTYAPSNKSAGKIARVLGVNPVWLMGFRAPKYPESESSIKDDSLNQEEKDLIKMYRYIDDDAKHRIYSALNTEYGQAIARVGKTAGGKPA